MKTNKVILVRDVRCPELDGLCTSIYYAKWHELPIEPYKGLHILVDDGVDPSKIKWVFINASGDIVCVLPACIFDRRDLEDEVLDREISTETLWNQQKKYILSALGGGWKNVGPLPCYDSNGLQLRKNTRLPRRA